MENIIQIILKDQNKLKERIEKIEEENNKSIKNIIKWCEHWRDGIDHYQNKYHIEFLKHKKTIKKLTLIAILATLCNSISISIILILWR